MPADTILTFDLGIAPGELILIGGGARSDLWAQIKADILGMPVFRPRHTEAASLGAAILAATAIGILDDPAAAARDWNPPVETFTPDPQSAAFCQNRRQLFEETYRALQPIYSRLQASPAQPH